MICVNYLQEMYKKLPAVCRKFAVYLFESIK